MTSFDTVSAYPLTWPTHWPRTKSRSPSRFGKHSMIDSITKVYQELERMGVRDYDVVLSSNVELRRDGLPYSNRRRPDDPGVAVYFKFKKEPHVLACDRWNTPEENLWALAKHIEALRGQDRWGVGSLIQAFSGYKQLPAAGESSARPWYDVFEVDNLASSAGVREAYARAVKAAHPDHGGSAEQLERVLGAWREFKAERGL